MKDYKRLTKWSDLGTLHIFDINGKEIPLCEATPLDFDNLAGRLASLEDKIESGELCDREEYEKLKLELAQKIYDDIFAILKIKLWLYGDDAMTKNLNGLTKQKILDFTKKWGIEDNHLNEKDYSHIDHLQAHDKQIKEQANKETAGKILKPLYYSIMEHPDCCVNLSEDIKFLMEKYGIDLGDEE